MSAARICVFCEREIPPHEPYWQQATVWLDPVRHGSKFQRNVDPPRFGHGVCVKLAAMGVAQGQGSLF